MGAKYTKRKKICLHQSCRLSPFQSFDFCVKLSVGRECFPVIVRGSGRIRKIKQLGFLSPEMYGLASAPAREPNAKGSAGTDDEKYFPRVEEPLEEPPNNYNCACISTVPRGSTQMFEDRGNRVTAQLVFAGENAEVGAVRVRSVHGGNVVASGGEPVRVELSLRRRPRKQMAYISVA